MFEEITERGYVVIFGDGVKVEAPFLRELIERVSEQFPQSKVLIIVDNIQRRGSEELFKVFNESFDQNNGIDSDYHIRFLFAARQSELDIARTSLEHGDRDEINDAISHMKHISLSFKEEDAIKFLKQAIIVTNVKELIATPDLEIEKEAKTRYEFSHSDLFMFIYTVRHFIGGNRLYSNFVEEEME
jgi:hypothetical protein